MEAIDYYTNQHLDQQEKVEIAIDRFTKEIDDDLLLIANTIQNLRQIAKGYDYNEVIEDELQTLLEDLI